MTTESTLKGCKVHLTLLRYYTIYSRSCPFISVFRELFNVESKSRNLFDFAVHPVNFEMELNYNLSQVNNKDLVSTCYTIDTQYCCCFRIEWKPLMASHSSICNKCIYQQTEYRRSGNFRDNFIFANGVKRHICDI